MSKSGVPETFPKETFALSATKSSFVDLSNVISLPDVAPVNFTSSLNVVTPAMLTLSKFVCPSISISAFASMLPAKE